MALISFDFHSSYLAGDARINAALPDCPDDLPAAEYYPARRKHKVPWLLHGGKGDCTDWIRKSRIELYTDRYRFAVVMPPCYNTMYMDWLTHANGYRLNPFLFEELLPMVHHWLPVSDAREDNFPAGLGGGGVAAFKYAMTRPALFSAVAALSTNPRDYDRLFANGIERYPKFVRLEMMTLESMILAVRSRHSVAAASSIPSRPSIITSRGRMWNGIEQDRAVLIGGGRRKMGVGGMGRQGMGMYPLDGAERRKQPGVVSRQQSMWRFLRVHEYAPAGACVK